MRGTNERDERDMRRSPNSHCENRVNRRGVLGFLTGRFGFLLYANNAYGLWTCCELGGML